MVRNGSQSENPNQNLCQGVKLEAEKNRNVKVC